MDSFRVAIPARYASTRLPGKPLRMLGGRTMLEHVYQRALLSGAAAVTIATDDERIAAAARGFGADVHLTSPDHPSGTDRLAELATRLRWADDDLVVNLQGDEPLVPPELIRQTAETLLQHPAAGIATLCVPLEDAGEFWDPNVVKVVRAADGSALYFSRAPIPYCRDHFAGARPPSLPGEFEFFRHLGLYAYRVGVLRAFPAMNASPIERAEALEQLRALWHGIRIQVDVARQVPPPGVDTEADLARAAKSLSGVASLESRS